MHNHLTGYTITFESLPPGFLNAAIPDTYYDDNYVVLL